MWCSPGGEATPSSVEISVDSLIQTTAEYNSMARLGLQTLKLGYALHGRIFVPMRTGSEPWRPGLTDRGNPHFLHRALSFPNLEGGSAFSVGGKVAYYVLHLLLSNHQNQPMSGTSDFRWCLVCHNSHVRPFTAFRGHVTPFPSWNFTFWTDMIFHQVPWSMPT